VHVEQAVHDWICAEKTRNVVFVGRRYLHAPYTVQMLDRRCAYT
jgi:hypothetical protein